MSERVLKACINDRTVGVLREESGLWAFAYSAAWLSDPHRFVLAPQLPLAEGAIVDGASRRPVQWYFDNLLPEEGQRVLLAAEAHRDVADAFGLLTHYGAESAGSLTLVEPDAAHDGRGELRPLQDAELSERIRRMPKVPLIQGAPKRMSLAGAQHKLAVVLRDDALFEPAAAQVSTHILKPDHPHEDYPHSAINEWFVMQLAGRVGLEVPAVHRRYVPESVYIVDRFDRVQAGDDWQRIHVVDACQLLGLDRSFKYSQGSVERLAEIAQACRSPAVARTRLFAWLVFNVLTGNSDAHLKNLSFRVDHEGIRPAPHYDLLCIACYDSRAFDRTGWPQQTQLAWPIGEARRFADVDRETLLRAAGTLGIARTTAIRQLDELVQRIVPAARALYDQAVAGNAAMLVGRPALDARLAGEARCLRTIIHTVIRPMAARVA